MPLDPVPPDLLFVCLGNLDRVRIKDLEDIEFLGSLKFLVSLPFGTFDDQLVSGLPAGADSDGQLSHELV
jgi:hypothetical protein